MCSAVIISECLNIYMYNYVSICIHVCVSGGPENDVWVYCLCVLCFLDLQVNTHREVMFVIERMQGGGGGVCFKNGFHVFLFLSDDLLEIFLGNTGAGRTSIRKLSGTQVQHKHPLLCRKVIHVDISV